MGADWCLAAGLCVLFLSQAAPDKPADAGATPAEIEAAIKQLGDEDFQTRERATELLIKAGDAAQAAAELAAKSNDPEVALRAKIILKRLASGIRPDTPPHLVALIEEFGSVDRNRRSSLIYRLSQPDEFRIIWDQISKEPDASQRSSLESVFRGRLGTLVGERYRGNKFDDAEALLRAAPSHPYSEASLLTLQFASGRLPARIDEQMKEVSAKPSQAGHRRLALLHRAAGDLAKAREVAGKLDDKELALWLAAEAADWTAALRLNRAMYEGKEPTIEQLAFTLLLACYARDKESLAATKEELMKRVAARPEDSWPVAEALLSAEQLDDGIKILETSVPAAAFYLHWYRTHYDRAFALAGVKEGATIDKAWYDALPDGNVVNTSYSTPRPFYANDIAGCLHYVGRREDARKVRDLLRDALQNEPPSSRSWAALVSTDLRLGLRDLALEDAARGLAMPAGAPPRRPGMPTAFNSTLFNELYGDKYSAIWYPLWNDLAAANGDDPLAALKRIEALCHGPSAARLSRDERRERLLEFAALPTGTDRYRHGTLLREVGWLAARLGEEDLAYRFREQSLAEYPGANEAYRQQIQASEAYRDEDWSAVIQHFRRFEQAGGGNSIYHAQLAMALDKLGQHDEARKLRDAAIGWRIEPGTYAVHGQNLLMHGLKPQAAERYRVAALLFLPGDGATINALNSLGNALYEENPAAAVPLWQLNMLGPLRGNVNMTLDVYVKNLCVIHRVQARDLVAQGKYQEAMAHGFAELDAMPGNVAVIEQLVPLLDEKGQQPLADELFAKSFATYAGYCEQFPQTTNHRNVLARTAARAKRKLDEALKAIDEAIAIDGDRAELFATLAEVRLARGERDAAVAAAEQGLKIEPGHDGCDKMLAKARAPGP